MLVSFWKELSPNMICVALGTSVSQKGEKKPPWIVNEVTVLNPSAGKITLLNASPEMITEVNLWQVVR